IARPYLAGIRAAIESLPPPVEYQLLGGLTPAFAASLEESIVDGISISLLMSFQLSANWQFELLRAELSASLGPDRARALAPMLGPDAPLVAVSDPGLPNVSQQFRDPAYGA